MGKLNSVIHYLKNKMDSAFNLDIIKNKKEKFIEWMDHHPWKTLIILYFVFVGVKVIISQIYVDPTCPADGYLYTRMARSFWHGEGFMVNGLPSHKYPPLYPMFISPAFIFDDMVIAFRAIRIINAFLSSLIIFPAFLLSREFLDIKKSIFVSMIVSSLAGSTAMVFKVFSENLFYPLFLVGVYFLYKSIFEKGYTYKLVAGFFVGLCFLTKYVTVAMFPAILIIYIFTTNYKRNDAKLKLFIGGIRKWLIFVASSIIVISPWLIRNGLHFGFSITDVLGLGYTGEFQNVYLKTKFNIADVISSFFTQAILHNGFLILGSGVIFFIFSFLLFKKGFYNRNIKLFSFGSICFIISECFVLLIALRHTPIMWKLMGRYVEATIPLFIIFGFSGLQYLQVASRRLYLLLGISVFPMLFLMELDEHFINLLSISELVAIKKMDQYVTIFGVDAKILSGYLGLIAGIFIIAIVLIFVIISKSHLQKRLFVFFSSCILLSATAVGCVAYLVGDWYASGSAMYEFGSFINMKTSGKGETVFFDSKMMNNSEGERLQHMIGSWINAPIKIVNISENLTENASYLISTNILNYSLVYESNISDPFASVLSWKPKWEKKVYVYRYITGI